MVSKRLFLVAIGVLAAAMIGAGCGGSDDPEITKAEFIKEVDAVCAKGNKQIETKFIDYVQSTGFKVGQQPSEKQLEELLETLLIPTVEQETEEIEDLGMPKGDEQEVEALLAAIEEGREKAEEDPKSVILETGVAFAKADELAKKYGLKVCGTR